MIELFPISNNPFWFDSTIILLIDVSHFVDRNSSQTCMISRPVL